MFGIVFPKKPFNYKQIDELVSRSAQPRSKAHFKWLKRQGVTDIVNFRMRQDIGNYTESDMAAKVGIKYHHIPTNACIPKEEQIGQFLDIVNKVDKKGGKIHIHCRAGADRTGMYSWIYKQKNGIGEMAENEREMKRMGHDQMRYPKLIGWIKEYILKDWRPKK